MNAPISWLGRSYVIALHLLRRLLHVPTSISHEQAIDIARAECERRGWLVRGAFHVVEDLHAYHVTNAPLARGRVHVWVRVDDGSVVRAEREAP